MLWVKSLHIIFMVTWFAGLFYLPRLFVYHAQTSDSVGHERFVVMERKLFIIMSIGAVLTILFGLWLVVLRFTQFPYWLHIKLGLVALLIGYHLYCFRIIKRFRNNANLKSHVFYRWFNEAPVLLLFAIVTLAVIKPFQ